MDNNYSFNHKPDPSQPTSRDWPLSGGISEQQARAKCNEEKNKISVPICNTVATPDKIEQCVSDLRVNKFFSSVTRNESRN